MRMKIILLIAGALSMNCASVFGGGRPRYGYFSCPGLEPIDSRPSTAEYSFEVQLSSKTYGNGEPITITVNSPTGDFFTNTMVRTHCTSCSDPRADLGTFSMVDETLSFFDCDDIQNSAVIAGSYEDRTSLNIEWTPNPFIEEELYFEASFLIPNGEWSGIVKSTDLVSKSEPVPTMCGGSTRSSVKQVFLSIVTFVSIIM